MQQRLAEMVSAHQAERDAEDIAAQKKNSSASASSASPRSSAAIRGDGEVMELMQKCMAVQRDLQRWGEYASTHLQASVAGLKTLTRKQSSASMSLGKSMEGFLTKRAMSGKNSWKKRYFVLRPSGSHAQPYVSLKYMEKKTSKKVKGTISLSAHTSMSLLDDIKGHSFAFEVHEGADSLAVSAPDAAARDAWLDALRACVDLFTVASSSSTSAVGDHFAALLKHMNEAKASCAKLLRLNDELKELKSAFGTTQKLMK